MVLVVDDEAIISGMLRMALESSDHDVLEARNADEARSVLDTHEVDLIVLDVMLGDEDGFSFASTLRSSGNQTPVLFVTARDDIEDKVHGLALGDDYLTKPFLIQELEARVDALLRRGGTTTSQHLVVGDLVLDERTFVVTRDGVELPLSPTEFRLVRYLMQNTDHVVTRADILRSVWQYENGNRATVDTYISYIRRKIDEGRAVPMLVTVRGFGYQLRPGP